MSHLKGHTDYGHQAVGVMLSCNGVVLNYDNVMYDKTKSNLVRHTINLIPSNNNIFIQLKPFFLQTQSHIF